MLYAILAYHVEDEVKSWTAQEDATVMAGLLEVHEKLKGRLGPAVRLGDTRKASTLRGPGHGTVIDGPFAETKEQLLGFYVIDCADEDEAIAAARELRRANPSAVYEIRATKLYTPGAPFPRTAGTGDAQNMIRKSAKRFSERIMRKQESKARWRFKLTSSRFSLQRLERFGNFGSLLGSNFGVGRFASGSAETS